MGMDVVELVISLEEELKIKLPDEVVSSLWDGRKDIQVRDFVEMIVEQNRLQISSYDGDIVQVVKRMISYVSGISESRISLDAWFSRDLDLQ